MHCELTAKIRQGGASNEMRRGQSVPCPSRPPEIPPSNAGSLRCAPECSEAKEIGKNCSEEEPSNPRTEGSDAAADARCIPKQFYLPRICIFSVLPRSPGHTRHTPDSGREPHKRCSRRRPRARAVFGQVLVHSTGGLQVLCCFYPKYLSFSCVILCRAATLKWATIFSKNFRLPCAAKARVVS